jgi:hypothetical protein
MHVGLVVTCCLGFVLPAAAQLDSSVLRAKYGAPLNREIFRMPSGFDLTVDYAAGNQVCKLEVPALMPTDEKISNATVMKQRMYSFLSDLVPGSTRGRELGQRATVMGTISLLSVEYEHVIINELQHADQPFGNNTITVTFKDNKCQDVAGQ